MDIYLNGMPVESSEAPAAVQESRRQRVKVAALKPVISRNLLMAILFALIVCFGIAYLIHFNGVATKGYEIARLENQRDDLLNLKEQNNISLSESQTLEFIKTSAKVQRMRVADNVEYYWPVRNSEIALLD